MVHLVLNYQLKIFTLSREKTVLCQVQIIYLGTIPSSHYCWAMCSSRRNASICDSSLEITDTFHKAFLNFRDKCHVFRFYVCILYLLLYYFSLLLKGLVITAKLPKGHGTFPFIRRELCAKRRGFFFFIINDNHTQ